MRTAPSGRRCVASRRTRLGAHELKSFLPQTQRDRKRRQVESARNARRLHKRAYARFEAELAAWGARERERLTQGWAHPQEIEEEPPPELHGDHTQAIVRTGGAEIIFLLCTTNAAAGADSGSAADDDGANAERNWRARSGKSTAGPPKVSLKRQRRLCQEAAHLAQRPVSRSTASRQYSSRHHRATGKARNGAACAQPRHQA